MAQTSLLVTGSQNTVVSAMGANEGQKGELVTPKRMLKSLKRAYSSSMACIETHKRLSSYQSMLHKKLAVRTTTKEDLAELRKMCEDLVYIAQAPQDRGTYSSALRLLSSMAGAPNPVAFLLVEPHIGPVLQNVLETSTHIPEEKALPLMHLLEHLRIRHCISDARYTILQAAGKDKLDVTDLISADRACRKVLSLFADGPVEMWVNLMAQDLFATVAKHPAISPSLLAHDIYPQVLKIAKTGSRAFSDNRLVRRLAHLAAESSQIVIELRAALLPLLALQTLDQKSHDSSRALCTDLLHLVLAGQAHDRTDAIALLELMAGSRSPISWILTEASHYELVERIWAWGTLPVDNLYRLVQGCLEDRLTAIETYLKDLKGSHTPTEELLLGMIQDLINICISHHIYDEMVVYRAAGLLLDVSSAQRSVSSALLDPRFIESYPKMLEDAPNMTFASRSARLVAAVKRMRAREAFHKAESVVSRLKHTRTWSGLDTDSFRPLCETLVSSALNKELGTLRTRAVTALLDLTRSPPDCAAILLEPELSIRIQSIAAHPEEHVSAADLSCAMSSLELQRQLREDIPRLYKLSNLQSIDHKHLLVELEDKAHRLVQLQYKYEEDEGVYQVLATSLLLIATGFAPSQSVLEQCQGKGLITGKNTRRPGFEAALRDVMRQLERTADELLRQPQREEKDRIKFQVIFYRLTQLCHLDFADWSTDASVELLGALAKASESTRVGILTPEIVDNLHKAAQNKRVSLPVKRILSLLGVEAKGTVTTANAD